jgi:outer membrane protein
MMLVRLCEKMVEVPGWRQVRRSFSVLGVSAVTAVMLSAQVSQAMNLSEMQEKALERRDVIQRYVTNLEKSEQDIKRARGGYLPSVDVAYTVNALDNDGFNEAEENSVVTGNISWNLFSGFRDKYNIASAETLKEVEAHRLQSIRQDIQLNVALKYLSVYERRANLKVSQDAVTTLSKIYKDGESRLDVGLIDKNELLKFKVDLDNADITMKAAQASLEKSILLLAREIDGELKLEDLDFKDFSEIPALGNESETSSVMLEKRSEIKALKGLVDASTLQIEAEKSDYYPRIDLEGSYLRYDDDFLNGNGDDDEDELRARVVMSMNLFKGFTDEAEIGKAKLEARGLQYDLAELEKSLETELQNLFIDLRVSLENVTVADQNIKLAKESLRITKLKYDEGLQRESDLLDAITNLSRAQFNYVTVVRSVFENHFRIQRMVEGFMQ